MDMSEITATSYKDSIAAAVRAECGRLGLKQTDLRPVIGKSRAAVADRWYGRKPYTTKELDDISELLGITPYNLNESAELASKFADSKPSSDEVARITPPQEDDWAQPARSKRRAS